MAKLWPGNKVQEALNTVTDVVELRGLEVGAPRSKSRPMTIRERHLKWLVIEHCWFHSGLLLENVVADHVLINNIRCDDGAGTLYDLELHNCVVGGRLRITTHDSSVAVRAVRLRRVEMSRGANLLVAVQEVDLRQSSFGAPSSLASLEVKGSTGRPRLVSLYGAVVPDLSIRGFDLKSCRMTEAQRLESARFADCDWPRSTGLVPRRVVYEEVLWRRQWPARAAESGRGRLRGDIDRGQSERIGWPPRRWTADLVPAGREPDPERLVTAWDVEEIYRALQRGAIEAGNHPVAAAYAWGAYTMRRLAGRERYRVPPRPPKHPPPSINRGLTRRRGGVGDRSLIRLYRVFGGYGLRARWPTMWLMLLIAVTGVVLGRWGYRLDGAICLKADACWGNGRGSFSLGAYLRSTSTAMGYVLSLARPTTGQVAGWVPGVITVIRLLGVALLGLAALAVRSRVRR